MTDVKSSLTIGIVDDVSAGAKSMAEALRRATADAQQLSEALAKSGVSQRLQDSLRRLGAGADHIRGVTAAWQEYAKAEGLAANRSEWTRDQAKSVQNLERVTVASVRAQMGAEAAQVRARHDAAAAEIRDAARAAAEIEKLQRAETEAAIMSMRRRAQERARLADAEIREAKRAADAEIRESKRAADAAAREAAREARDVERARHRELEDARRHHEAVSRMSVGHYALQSAAMSFSGHGVVAGVEAGLEKGSELQNARGALRQAGVTPEQARGMEREAMGLTRRYGNVSQTGIMELSKEIRSVLKDPNEIGKVLPALTAAKSILDANDRTGGQSENLNMLVRGSESIGAAQNPERLVRLVDSYVKAIQVMGKTINPEQIYEFDKYAKTAGARMSDRFLMTTGLSLAQEMGGSTAGNDIAQVQKAIATGFGKSHQAVRNMMSVGMLDASDVEMLPTGEANIKGGHKVRGADTAATDLDLWVYNSFLPQLEKHGIKTESKQLDFVMRTFTGTQADVIAKLITQRGSFENHAKLYGGAEGIRAADNWDSATKGLDAFTTSLGNLLANLSSPMMADIGHVLHGVSLGLDDLAAYASKHPRQALAAAGVVTGGAVAVAGTVGANLMNGFGLGTAATALDGSAAALTTAAEALTGSAVAKGAGGVVGTAEGVAAGAAGLSAGMLAAAAAAGAAAAGLTIVGLNKATPDSTASGRPQPPVIKEQAGHWAPGRAGMPAQWVGAGKPTSPPPGHSAGPGDATGYHAGIHPMAYRTGDTGGSLGGAEEAMTRAVSAGFLDAFRQIQMGAAGGAESGGGAAGLINASYETGDAGGFGGSSAGRSSAAGLGGGGYRGLSGANLSGGGASGERADFIRSVAAKLGIDPRVAVAVAKSEGLGGLVGDHGTSWGDFQLHRGGLADIYEKQTGNSASDPSKWKEADEWALKYAAKNGWGSWHGAARIGVTGMMGVGAGGTAVGPGSIGKGDAVGLAEGMLGANSAQAQAMLKHRMTPGEWCADFVNGVIQGAGGHGVNSSMARAFDTWGRAVGANDAKRGDVILERHGNHTGHVGIATGPLKRDAQGNVTAVQMVSGNYGGRVRTNWERVGIIGGMRRGSDPDSVPLPRRQAPAIAHDAGGIQASLFDHDNIDGAISKVRALRREVASLGAASVSVVHGSNAGPRGPSRSAVNRAIRGGPSAGGSTFA